MDLHDLTVAEIAILDEMELDPCTATPDEVFDAFLRWEGFVGYDRWIKGLVRRCYGLEVSA